MKLCWLLIGVLSAYYINTERLPKYEASRQWTVNRRGMTTDKSFETKHFQGKREDGQRVNTVIAKNQRVDFSVVPNSQRTQNGLQLRTIRANGRVQSQTHNLDVNGNYVAGKTKNKPLVLGQKFVNGQWVTDHYGGYYQEDESYDEQPELEYADDMDYDDYE